MGIGNLKKKDVWEKSMSLGYKGNERLAHQRNLGKGRKEFPFILNAMEKDISAGTSFILI